MTTTQTDRLMALADAYAKAYYFDVGGDKSVLKREDLLTALQAREGEAVAQVDAIGVDGKKANVTAMYGKSLHVGQFLYLEAQAAPQPAQPETLVRYCPDCGSIGPVPASARDCCPDGQHARMVPENFAKSCGETFMRAISAQPEQGERVDLYSLDRDTEGIRARVVHAVLGALAFGARNENKPPADHWLSELWEAARAERDRKKFYRQDAMDLRDELNSLRELQSAQPVALPIPAKEFEGELWVKASDIRGIGGKL